MAKYLNLEGLEEYDNRIKNYISTFCSNQVQSTIETFNVLTTDWLEDSTIAPFVSKAVIILTTPIDTYDVVSLVNFDITTRIGYGVTIGDVSGQTLTLYALATPSENITAGAQIINSSVVLETVTLQTTDWIADADITPFTYKASKVVAATLGANSAVSIIGMPTTLQARYGIIIGDITGQTVTYYALLLPESNISSNILVEG